MNIDELVNQYNTFVEACNQHHAVDDVMAAKKILAQIYEYTKRLEAEINAMKRCATCKHDNIQHSYADGKHSKATLSSVCKDCVKKGMGKYADWEFNPELIKEK